MLRDEKPGFSKDSPEFQLEKLPVSEGGSRKRLSLANIGLYEEIFGRKVLSH